MNVIVVNRTILHLGSFHFKLRLQSLLVNTANAFLVLCLVSFIVKIYQVTIFRKIRGNSQESFQGISGNSPGKSGENVDSYSAEFLVTHSEDIIITLSKEFIVTNSREFLVTNSSEKPEKMSTKFLEILVNFQRKVLSNQFLGTIPKIFSRVPQEYLEISSAYSWVNSLTRNEAQK